MALLTAMAPLLPAVARSLCAVAAATLMLSSCAGAPVRPAPRVVWPASPEAPRVRWVASFPSEDVTVAAPVWKRVLNAVIGLQPPDDPGAPLLVRPFGVAARSDSLIVADPDGRKVLAVAWPAGSVTPLECTDHRWGMPMSVAIGQDGSVFVADGEAKAVVRIHPGGRCQLLGSGLLDRPTGLAVAEGILYVVDPPRHQVVALSPDGQELLRLGNRGEGAAELNFPTSIAAEPSGDLLVVDALNFRISRFRPSGESVGSFGNAGDGAGDFARPKAVVVGPGGRIFVSDAQNGVVTVFRPDGGFDFAFGAPTATETTGALAMPAGLSVLGNRLFVADPYMHRIQIYELIGGAL